MRRKSLGSALTFKLHKNAVAKKIRFGFYYPTKDAVPEKSSCLTLAARAFTAMNFPLIVH